MRKFFKEAEQKMLIGGLGLTIVGVFGAAGYGVVQGLSETDFVNNKIKNAQKNIETLSKIDPATAGNRVVGLDLF